MKRVQKVQSLNKLTLNAKLRKTVTYFNQCLIVLTKKPVNIVYPYQPLHNFYCVNPNYACATVGRTLTVLGLVKSIVECN